MDSVQRALVSKTTIIKPDRRYDEIMRIIQERKFQSDRYVNALNIQINTNEMMKIQGEQLFPKPKFLVLDNILFVCILARVLTPPAVKYRGQGNNEVVENVSMGKWTIRNRFHSTPAITKWAIYHFGPKPNERIIPILQEFEHELPTVRFE